MLDRACRPRAVPAYLLHPVHKSSDNQSSLLLENPPSDAACSYKGSGIRFHAKPKSLFV